MGAPFIMPDGKSLAYHLRHERDEEPKKSRGKSKSRPKDDLWAHMMSMSQTAGTSASEYDLAEYRVLSQVGHRRRARWFNEKLLRDMAGPLTAADMEGQFKPPPFGMAYPTPFSEVMEKDASTWDNFRSIDYDKQKKVLQKWDEHIMQKQAASRGESSSTSEGVALASWSRVQKPARQALRKASIHNVLDLETQIMDWMHQGDGAPLQMAPQDAFCRLVIHGLCQFHSLLSSTQPAGSSSDDKAVTISHPSSSSDQPRSTEEATTSSPLVEDDSLITCTDVLLALEQYGSAGLTHSLLAQFVQTHIHGIHSPAILVADPSPLSSSI